jgi:hypothetical protein
MLALAVLWVLIRFFGDYMSCRTEGGKATCVIAAFVATVVQVLSLIADTVSRLISIFLP